MNEELLLAIRIGIYFHERKLELRWQIGAQPPVSLEMELDDSTFKSEAARRRFEEQLPERFKSQLPAYIDDGIQGLWVEIASAIGIELGATAWEGVSPDYAKREIVEGHVERQKELMRSILRTRAPGRPESRSSVRLRREIRTAIKQILKGGGSPKLEAVAAHMDMSKAALARQIGRKGLSFKAIRQEVLGKVKKRT